MSSSMGSMQCSEWYRISFRDARNPGNGEQGDQVKKCSLYVCFDLGLYRVSYTYARTRARCNVCN